MAKILVFSILFIFSSISLVGFALVSGAHHSVRCPAEQMQSSECSAVSDPLTLLSFHIEAFNSFASGIFSNSAVGELLVIFIAVSLTVASILTLAFPPSIDSVFYRFAYLNFWVFRATKKIIHWLSLHENSPSLAN